MIKAMPVVRVMAKVVAVWLALAASAQPLAAQPPAAQTPPRDPVARPEVVGTTNTVRGRVTRADDGLPIRAAQIWLTRDVSQLFGAPEENLPSTVTDTDGRYELVDLPSGLYIVTAAKSGFVALKFGQVIDDQVHRSVRVGSATVLGNIDFALPRAGAVEGQIVDGSGEPIVGATVRLLRREQGDAGFKVGAAAGVADSTRDDGRYRVHGVAPGKYLLAVSVLADQVTSPDLLPDPSFRGRVTYYPGTSSVAEAQLVDVVAGGDTPQFVIGVHPPARAAISGHITSLDGQPAGSTTLTLRASGPETTWMQSTHRTRPDGTFRLTNLEPGTYTLTAENTRGEMATTRVTLAGADADVRMVLGTTTTIRGRLAFVSGKPPASGAEGFGVSARPADGGDFKWSNVAGDWRFEIAGLSGAVELVAQTPRGWSVERIRTGSRDVRGSRLELDGLSDVALEVRITDRVTGVKGQVKDGRGRPVPNVALVVFPVDTAKRKSGVSIISADSSGTFQDDDMEPGAYFVAVADPAALRESASPDEFPAMLERVQPDATRVTVREGQMETIEVRAGGL